MSLNLKLLLKSILIFVNKIKYWFLICFIIFLLPNLTIIYLNRGWFFGGHEGTYYRINLLGEDIGGLKSGEISEKLIEIKNTFEDKKIRVIHGNDEWSYSVNDLGINFDVNSTKDSIWKLNDENLIDKYGWILSDKKISIKPVIMIDLSTCAAKISEISIGGTDPIDAYIEFNNGVKIIKDQPGLEFSPSLTCENIKNTIDNNVFDVEASFDIKMATITEAEINLVISRINNMVGQDLTFKNGNYELRLSPKELIDLLDIYKSNSELVVDWNSEKIQELVDSIAQANNTYNSTPSLGACQYVASTGGYWLDKDATKNIFVNLRNDAQVARSYDLKIDYYNQIISERKPVGSGGSPIYLTFDDGMIYANQIMNYASCYGVKVTFFVIGSRAYVDANAMRRAINEGHAIQSHGYEHAAYDYGKRSYDWQYNDMKQSVDVITSVTGVKPTYFRPPGGNRSSDTYNAAGTNGLNLILWGVSSVDTVYNNSTSICNQVLSGAYSGASVLMHASNLATANAVPCIIEGLAARGYSMQALR